MIIRNTDGQIATVAYQFLAPLLLNEYQKQQRTLEQQQTEMKSLRTENELMKQRLEQIERMLSDRP